MLSVSSSMFSWLTIYTFLFSSLKELKKMYSIFTHLQAIIGYFQRAPLHANDNFLVVAGKPTVTMKTTMDQTHILTVLWSDYSTWENVKTIVYGILPK